MRCPDCGEPIHPKQIRCFACDADLRFRRFRYLANPVNLRIILFCCLLFGLGIGGLVIRNRIRKAAAHKPLPIYHSHRTSMILEEVNPDRMGNFQPDAGV
ncbi:MAG: hypothetical protein N2248_04745 [candidate division WOR-3 bacterium]|uniref:Uncharacterized protein n=1 Tax=candidate division WOR-3 bacterium TaxID=2052148 RepID=A0A7C1SND6_UNCW3|nr:hypothetical protein [candidate division WOR-3 bacterium]